MELEKPTIDFPGLEPPAEMESEDIKVGSGDEATSGNTVSVHYVGVAFSTGEQFDASWDREQAFEFTLGAGQVIKGWDEGVAGMKVGGRRKLTLPPSWAYGDRGAPPVIQPGETLIFVVDLLEVK
jgi:peptidylprolyl isomerase